MFNHKSYYANIQPDNKIVNTIFDIGNATHWKSMDSDIIKSLPPWQVNIEFDPLDNQITK